MATTSSIPISRRTETDLVVRDGESYIRRNLDRPIRLIDFIFSTLGNLEYGINPEFVRKVRPWQYPENTPTQVAARVVQTMGHVAIADIGCGTGNVLLSWGNKIASQTKCGLGQVSMTGVSRQDYRGESMHVGTNRAFKRNSPPIRYVVGDAKNMVAIEDNSQDVVLAYNSLKYGTEPDIWLGEMLRIGRPGGTVLFNCEFEHVVQGQPLVSMLDKLHDSGYRIRKVNFMVPDSTSGVPADVQVVLGMTDNAVLCRIDIPRD